MSKDLLFCMTHIRLEEQANIFRVWQELAFSLNDCDLLIVESKSPLAPETWLTGDWDRQDAAAPKITKPRTLAAFPDALGHPYYDKITHGAGSDRAWMKGFEIAIENGYDRVAYIEADILCAKPISDIFNQMIKPAACGPLVSHGKFPETGLFFADCNHLKQTDFISKYNWQGPCWPEGEKRAWDILGDSLEILPLRGVRDEWLSTPRLFRRRWEQGVDYVTHAKPEVLREFLRMTDHQDLTELL